MLKSVCLSTLLRQWLGPKGPGWGEGRTWAVRGLEVDWRTKALSHLETKGSVTQAQWA